MHALEDVFSPALLNAVRVHEGAELIVLRDACDLNGDIYTTGAFEEHCTEAVFRPLLKLPLHFYLFVLL